MFNLLDSLDLGCGVGAGRDSEDVFTVSTCPGGGRTENQKWGGGGWRVLARFIDNIYFTENSLTIRQGNSRKNGWGEKLPVSPGPTPRSAHEYSYLG